MKAANKQVKLFAQGLIVYGVINMLGNAGYKDFKLLCAGLHPIIILAVYLFGIVYGIMSILCGTRILRLENWARKTAIIFVLISLIIGLFITPLTLRNLEIFYSGNAALQNISLAGLVKTYIFFAMIFTLFEIAFIYFFTRPYVKAYFQNPPTRLD